MVLRPLKKLTVKLNGDENQIEALIEERKEDRKQKERLFLQKIISGGSGESIGSSEVSNSLAKPSIQSDRHLALGNFSSDKKGDCEDDSGKYFEITSKGKNNAMRMNIID